VKLELMNQNYNNNILYRLIEKEKKKWFKKDSKKMKS